MEINDDVANVTLNDVNSAFRRLDAEKDPDKAGSESLILINLSCICLSHHCTVVMIYGL